MSTASVISPVETQKTTIPETLAQTEARIRAELEQHYKELHLVWRAKDLADLEEKMDRSVQEQVQKAVDGWVEEQKPPTVEQIQQMVDQEYIEFKIKLRVPWTSVHDTGPEEHDEFTEKLFTIQELPQQIEKEFYRQVKKHLLDRASEMSAFVQKNLDKSFEERAKSFLNTFEGAFDVLADATVIVLNPWNRDPKIDRKWVQGNISSNRQWNIVQAQVESNRLRDFFSKLSQSGRKMQMVTEAPSYQGLQSQLR